MNFIELKPGTSVEGESIAAYKTEKRAERYLYLMAGTHGDEVEGVYVLKELFEWLKQDQDLELNIVLIPILNIDGYRAGTRGNSHGVDLNRNYPSNAWNSEYKNPKYYPGPSALSEPENQYLVKLFDKFPPYLLISFHSWKPLLNYNGDCKDIADFLSSYNSYQVVDDISYPTPGSLGEYGPQQKQCPVLTFECPPLSDELNLKSIWEQNQAGLIELMKSTIILPQKQN